MDINSDERQRKISYLAEFDEFDQSASENENENTEYVWHY